MLNNLIEQVLKTIRNYDMLHSDDTVLAAVSGGPDSVFLLHALASLKNKMKIKKIIVCNLDHGLRGKESEEDSAFVKRLAASLDLECIQKKVKIGHAKGLSMEESAREERYRFFKEAAEKSGAGVLATGHTLDDQAETVIMRIVKGASLKGLAGISPVREQGRLRIIRPLIELEKEEIAGYLEKKKIPYRIDHTNVQDIYFRNVVRRDIIPFLERYNPRLKRSLFNLAAHMHEDLDFINKAKEALRKDMAPQGGKSAEIDLKCIAVQPRTLQKEILRDLLEASGGEVKKLSFRHWKELEQLIKHKRKGNSVDLPGGIRITRTASALALSKL